MMPLIQQWWQVIAIFPGVLLYWAALEALVFTRRRKSVRQIVREAVLRLVLESRYVWWERRHDRALARYRRALETGTRREIEQAERQLGVLLNVR